MLFKEYTYSVLIVSSSEKFAASIKSMLPENEFGPVRFAKNEGEARRKLADMNFDTVIINTPLVDDFSKWFFHFDLCYKGLPEFEGDTSTFTFTSLTPGVTTEIDDSEGKVGLTPDKVIFTLTGTTPTEYTSENPLKGVFTFAIDGKAFNEFIIKLVGNIPVTAV